MKILMAETLLWNSIVRVGSHNYGRLFLENNNEVFFLSQYLHPFSLIKGKKVAYEMFWSWKDGVTNPGKNLLSYTPLSLIPYINYPVLSSKWVGLNNLKLSYPYLPKLLKEHGFHNVDILWITNPKYLSITKFIEYKVLIHRKADDDKEFSRQPQSLKNLSDELIKKSDIVFATAKNLFKDAKRSNNNTYYLPNGVNFEHFYDIEENEPGDISKAKKPRIVYIGAIDEWFDLNLLLNCAVKLKEYSFILIGPSHINLSALKNSPNIFILGPKNYNELPAYMKHSNVGIIPFKESKLCDSISPIKLFEYLASGLPVVSTNLQEVKNIDSPAILAKNGVEFIEALKHAVKNGKDKSSFIDFAKNNSWQNRYNSVKKIISEKLKKC